MELADLKTRIAASTAIVGFTGAGISTESGIPDYRGTGGIWTQYRVVTIQEFLASEEGRKEYWRRKSELWSSIHDAQPNSAHQAFTQLNNQGKLLRLITQNIDGLHQKAGLPADKIIELHGSSITTGCLECDYCIPTEKAVEAFQGTGDPPHCPNCDGWLKPKTISFGQSMPQKEMNEAADVCAKAEIFIVVGSSLAVQPAASLPVLAKEQGALLVIVNRNETVLDNMADVLLHGEAGEVMAELSEGAE